MHRHHGPPSCKQPTALQRPGTQPCPTASGTGATRLATSLRELKVEWERVRNKRLQDGSLWLLPGLGLGPHELMAIILRFEENLRAHLRDRHLLPAAAWANGAPWQLALLEVLALVASDFARSVLLEHSSGLGNVLANICYKVLTVINLLLSSFLSHEPEEVPTERAVARAVSAMVAALVDMELPQLFSSVMAEGWQQLEQLPVPGQEGGTAAVAMEMRARCSLAARTAVLFIKLLVESLPESVARAHVHAMHAIADAQLMEQVARMLLRLSAAPPAAAYTVPGPENSGSIGIGAGSDTLQIALMGYDGVLAHMSGTSPGRALLAARVRLLGGPCVCTYVAVRLATALHALDGRGCYGLPAAHLLPLPTAARQQPGPDPVVESKSAAARALCGISLWAFGGQTISGGASSSASTSTDAGCRIASLSLRPGDMYKLKLRTLRLALRPAGTAGSSAAGSSGNGPSSARSTAMATAQPAPASATQYARLPQPAAACSHHDAVILSTSALPCMWVLLPGLLAQSTAHADVRAREVLPLMVALLHEITGGGDGRGSSSSNGGRMQSGIDRYKAEAKAIESLLACLHLNCLLPEVRGAADQGPQRRLAAAVNAGLLPALQSCAMWLMPEAAVVDVQMPLFSMIIDLVKRHGAAAALMAPERQAAALILSLRSGYAALQAWLFRGGSNPGMDEACHAWSVVAFSLCEGLCEHAAIADALPGAASGRIAAFALQQQAVVEGQHMFTRAFDAVRLATTGREEAGRRQAALLCRALKRNHVTAHMAELTAEAPTSPEGGAVRARTAAASSGAGSGSPAAAGRGPFSSRRSLLLRDMRLLDVLACLVSVAARCRGTPEWAGHVLDLLQLAAYALPADVRQHVAAGQAAVLGRTVPQCAAGRGTVWLAVDPPLRALLGPARCNQPALLAFLEGRSQALPHSEVARTLAMCRTGPRLPAPCDVKLMETCDYPGCTDQVHCLTAARGMDGPLLKSCAKCGRVQYCSRACQEEHWRQWHKAECSKGWW